MMTEDTSFGVIIANICLGENVTLLSLDSFNRMCNDVYIIQYINNNNMLCIPHVVIM